MWIDQAITLGAKDTLRFLAKQLWFKYLRELGVAFKPGDKKESLSEIPTYRDLQVEITGRKKLIPAERLGARIKAKTRESKVAITDESDFDDDAVRKRRRKERRSFLKTLNHEDSKSVASGSRSSTHGDDSDDSDDELSSSVPPSTPKSGFYSDDDTFGLSLSVNTSMNNDSSSTGQFFETNSNQPSSGASATDSDTCSEFGVSRNIEDKNIDVHFNVLENINFTQMLGSKTTDKLGKRQPALLGLDIIKRPSVRVVFSIFCLAVLLNEDNWITLSDLTYWADCGSITYMACVLGIPQDMKLCGWADHTMFQPKRNATIGRRNIEDNIVMLGALLKLQKVDFAASIRTQILNCIGRFIRELSLPQSLTHAIEYKLGKLVLEGFKYCFPTTKEYNKKCVRHSTQLIGLPTLDVYSLALILFILKYDFGLDDRTEVKLSSVAVQQNTKSQGDAIESHRYFVFSEWLELSKRRIYLAAKYCYHLQQRFTKSLIPEAEPSLPCMVRSIEELSTHAQLVKSHLRGYDCTSDQGGASNSNSHNDSDCSVSVSSSEYSSISKIGWENTEHQDILRVSNFLRKEFNSDLYDFQSGNNDTAPSRSIKRNTLDLSTSDTPLHDFSMKQLEYNAELSNLFEFEDKVRHDEAEVLRALIDTYDHEILCPLNILEKCTQDEDCLRIGEKDIKDFIIAPLHAPRYETMTSDMNFSKVLLTSVDSRLPIINEGPSHNAKDQFINRKYWMTHFRQSNQGPIRFDTGDMSDIYSLPTGIQKQVYR